MITAHLKIASQAYKISGLLNDEEILLLLTHLQMMGMDVLFEGFKKTFQVKVNSFCFGDHFCGFTLFCRSKEKNLDLTLNLFTIKEN